MVGASWTSVVFAAVVGQNRLCLTAQAKGKDDESVSDLMTSSQTKGNRVSDVKL